MDLMELMVVALAGWMNQRQEDLTGLADCFATTSGMRHETDDFYFRTARGRMRLQIHAGRLILLHGGAGSTTGSSVSGNTPPLSF